MATESTSAEALMRRAESIAARTRLRSVPERSFSEPTHQPQLIPDEVEPDQRVA